MAAAGAPKLSIWPSASAAWWSACSRVWPPRRARRLSSEIAAKQVSRRRRAATAARPVAGLSMSASGAADVGAHFGRPNPGNGGRRTHAQPVHSQGGRLRAYDVAERGFPSRRSRVRAPSSAFTASQELAETRRDLPRLAPAAAAPAGPFQPPRASSPPIARSKSHAILAHQATGILPRGSAASACAGGGGRKHRSSSVSLASEQTDFLASAWPIAPKSSAARVPSDRTSSGPAVLLKAVACRGSSGRIGRKNVASSSVMPPAPAGPRRLDGHGGPRCLLADQAILSAMYGGARVEQS
jgi:hypothetical protein